MVLFSRCIPLAILLVCIYCILLSEIVPGCIPTRYCGKFYYIAEVLNLQCVYICIYMVFSPSPAQERCCNHWLNQYWLLHYQLCCYYTQFFTKLSSVNLLCTKITRKIWFGWKRKHLEPSVFEADIWLYLIFLTSCKTEGLVSWKIFQKSARNFCIICCPEFAIRPQPPKSQIAHFERRVKYQKHNSRSIKHSLDYSVHFPESHTDGSMKKKVHVYSGRNPGHCQGNTIFKRKKMF